MKGLELSRKFYEEIGAPMLKEQFADLLPYIAAGLAGSGSECYGFDDEISRDHDFEPAFCIFIPDESIVDSKTAFRLERAYAKLPRQFMGYERSIVHAVGGSRHGVIRTADFFEAKTGKRDGKLSVADWFTTPQTLLCEAVNGEVFFDNYGEFSKIRDNLKYFPENIRLKKLAGDLLLMGQAGQYNYNRCLLRGDTAAAQLAIIEFAKSALNVIFLLNKTYMPYYKLTFRALKSLSILNELSPQIEYLISSGNIDAETSTKKKTIENICTCIVKELKKQGITNNHSALFEEQAYAVNNAIKDNQIRNMNILCAV